jgi:membrane protein required for beta-lactamase induction
LKGIATVPKLDRLKEELAYQKYFVSISITLSIAVLGWLAINIDRAEWYIMAGGFVVVIFSLLFAYTRHKRVYQLLQEHRRCLIRYFLDWLCYQSSCFLVISLTGAGKT